MINSVCGIGSTGRICTDIADHLTKEGSECKIAYGRKGYVPEPALPYVKRIGNDFDVKVHGLLTRLFDVHGFGSRSATKEFVKWMKEYEPDIIHLHNLHGYYLHIGVLFEALKAMNKPVVWTLHDCWAFTGHCTHFTAADCNKWKTQCYDCVEKRRYPASVMLDRCKYNYMHKKESFSGVANLTIVTPSCWLSELAKVSFLKEYPITVILNGIDTSVFHATESNFRKRYRLEGKKIILGVAGVWDVRKGLSDMVQLSQLLGDDYAVIIVGLSDTQKKMLPESVLGITHTESTKELAEIYTAADVLVNPTYEDTYPTVNLEAQACGTPVITYRTGGSVESAHPDCVVELGDIAEIAKIIRFDTAKCRENLQFSCQTMIQQYLELYKRVI